MTGAAVPIREPDLPSDGELHARMLLGDEYALHQFQEKHGPKVLAMLCRQRVPDPEEVWNDALWALWRRLRSGRPMEPFGDALRFYLYRVAIDIGRRQRQRANRARTLSFDRLTRELGSAVEGGSAQFEPPVENELVGQLRECLRRLPEGRIRGVAKLASIGLTNGEIADALGIPENQVAVYKGRALVRLRRCAESL